MPVVHGDASIRGWRDNRMTEYSVVIPTYNRSDLLARAIAVVLAQSRPALEIIVVDDASTESIAAVAARFPGAPLRVVRHAQNRGQSAARNTGVEAARAPWIAFLDSDDEWSPSKAERQLAALTQGHSTQRASVTGYVIRDARDGRMMTFQPAAGQIEPDDLLFGCPFSVCSTMMVERAAFDAIGGFEPSMRRLEDWDWVMRYQRRYVMASLSDILVTVHKFHDPNYAEVAGAVAHLRELHYPAWRDKSWLAGRKFKSSLDVEEAAGAYYEGDNRKAVALTLQAIATYPFRNLAFYATLTRRFLRTLGLR
jgi:glycosyltransferase involved in cell wall biosynthesis